MRLWLGITELAGDYIGKPVPETTRDSVYGCMGTVDLLGVRLRQIWQHSGKDVRLCLPMRAVAEIVAGYWRASKT